MRTVFTSKTPDSDHNTNDSQEDAAKHRRFARLGKTVEGIANVLPNHAGCDDYGTRQYHD